MAKKATPASAKTVRARKSATAKPKAAARKPARATSTRKSQDGDFNAVDALLNLLQSPLVADLLAVGATAAMAAITETRHSRRTGSDQSTKMMKAAGIAAAAAIGRRLATEFEEIREVSKKSKAGAKA